MFWLSTHQLMGVELLLRGCYGWCCYKEYYYLSWEYAGSEISKSVFYGYLYFLAFYWHCCYKMHNTYLPSACARLVPWASDLKPSHGARTLTVLSGVQLLMSAWEPREVWDKFQGSPRSLGSIILTCFIGWITNCLSFLIVFFFLSPLSAGN